MNRFFILFCLNLLFCSYLLAPKPMPGEVKSAIYTPAYVSVLIRGKHRFRIFGYTSPLSLVTAQGQVVYDQAYSDNGGYFEINGYFYPEASSETCLQAYDQLGRTSAPVCLPPFPTETYVDVGPVIMPPTISLEKNSYYTGDDVVLSGQTVPSTSIDLSVYNQNSGIAGLAKKPFDIGVNAYSLPEFSAKVDGQGNYSIVLPSMGGSKYRLFATTKFSNNPSPQSIALSLKILPWWMVIINFIIYTLGFLKPYLLEIVIILQLALLLYLTYRKYFTFHNVSLSRALVLREKKQLVVR